MSTLHGVVDNCGVASTGSRRRAGPWAAGRSTGPRSAATRRAPGRLLPEECRRRPSYALASDSVRAGPRGRLCSATDARSVAARRRNPASGVADRASSKFWEASGAADRPSEALQEGPGDSPDAAEIFQEGRGDSPDVFWNPRKAPEILRTLPKISRRVPEILQTLPKISRRRPEILRTLPKISRRRPEILRTPSCQISNPVPSLLVGAAQQPAAGGAQQVVEGLGRVGVVSERGEVVALDPIQRLDGQGAAERRLARAQDPGPRPGSPGIRTAPAGSRSPRSRACRTWSCCRLRPVPPGRTVGPSRPDTSPRRRAATPS